MSIKKIITGLTLSLLLSSSVAVASDYDSATGDTYRIASIGFDYAAAGAVSVMGAMERLSSTDGVSSNSTNLSVNRKF